MQSSSVDTDVLIVGAGPVGLSLANECARRGLRWRLIEANSSQSAHSKALAIFPRTLEIFDMAGVVTPFLEAANRVTSVAVIAHKRRLAHMRFALEESPYKFVAMVPQGVTEKRRRRRVRDGLQNGGDGTNQWIAAHSPITSSRPIAAISSCRAGRVGARNANSTKAKVHSGMPRSCARPSRLNNSAAGCLGVP